MYGVVSVNLMIRSYVAVTKLLDLREQLLDAGEVMPGDELNTAVGLLTDPNSLTNEDLWYCTATTRPNLPSS